MQLPAESRILSLASHFSELCGHLKAETGAPKLVLPNASFFPDTFEPSARGVQRLLTRMQTHAQLLDVPVEVVVHDEEADHSAGACGSGACAPKPQAAQQARFELDGDVWRLNLMRGELGHSIGLTTLLARSLGWLLLEETRRETAEAKSIQPELAEFAAVHSGFGVLLLEGAHVYSKSCGGPQITQLTALQAPEIAVLVALYAAANQLSLRATYRELSTTQHSLLSEAEDLVRANPALSTWVRQGRPSSPGLLRLAPPRPRLLSWLRPKVREQEEHLVSGTLDEQALVRMLEAQPQTRALPTTRRKEPPRDDIAQLVEEALQETRS
jgi:hypothetical protein